MNLNLKSPFFLTKALAAPLRAAASADRPAKVINIASIDGIFVNPMETYSYAASKAGLIHLTRRMAAKLIGDHVVVTAIAPGPFASDMNRAARDHADDVLSRLKELGIELRITKLRIKPGKPFVFGVKQIARGEREGERAWYVFGLPGNPVSAFV